jgi:hypothetical protein
VLDPSAANFPVISNSSFRSSQTPTDCAAPNDGTNWEIVMTGVQAFTLTYFDDTNAILGTPWNAGQASDVRSIDVDMVLSRNINGTGGTAQSTFHTHKRYFLENSGGLVSPPPSTPAGPPPGPPPRAGGGCGRHCGREG